MTQIVLEKADDSEEGRWAKALALQCLGNVAYTVGNSEQAMLFWRQAGIYWSLLEERHRQVGILNNLANAMARAKNPFEEIVAVYNEALELLDKCNDVAPFKKSIYS